MKTTIITCDICGAPIGMNGGSVDLHAHDVAKAVLATYPPRRVGVYDLCAECCDELREWVTDHYSGWKSKQAEGIAIADRIDAEHEAKVSYWQGARTCKRVMDSIDPFTMWVCDHCGHPLDTSENFCGGCGRRIVQ